MNRLLPKLIMSGYLFVVAAYTLFMGVSDGMLELGIWCSVCLSFAGFLFWKRY